MTVNLWCDCEDVTVNVEIGIRWKFGPSDIVYFKKRLQIPQRPVVSVFVILQTGLNIVKDLPNRDLVMFPHIYALILFMLSPSFLR